VVHRSNHLNLCKTVPAVMSAGLIDHWQFFQFSPTGPLGHRNREKFQIDDREFARFRGEMERALSDAGFCGKAEFKTNRAREGAYVLVDSEGWAWSPVSPRNDGQRADGSSQREVLGNIAEAGDFPRIMAAIIGRKSPRPSGSRPDLLTPLRDLGAPPQG